MFTQVGKVSVITGGGGSIGSATSLIFAQQGAIVVVVDIDDEKGMRALDSIHQAGGMGTFIQADVTDIVDTQRVMSKAIKEYGHIDSLIHVAGGTKSVRLLETDDAMLEHDITLNLKSALYCTKAVLPSMIENGSGAIVYTSSVNAVIGGFSQSSYASAKSGLHSLAQTLTTDYSKYGPRFNVVCLGTIPGDSPRWRERQEEEPGTLDQLAGMYPVGRYGTPVDAANAFLFLASEEARWITGTALVVDGGITATGGLRGGRWWEPVCNS